MRLPVVVMRGGTSKGLFFHEADLPPFGPDRDAVLLRAMGSPDSYGRQLNGMGGGISSLSKTIVCKRSERDDVDVEFLHGQVAVSEALIDYSANCGNLSAAVGPFAVDERIVQLPKGEEVTIRVRSLNSNAIVHARFSLCNGRHNPRGDWVVPGVSGSGSCMSLEYLQPGEGGTGVLYPSNKVRNLVQTASGPIFVTLAFGTVPAIWVRATDLGISATIMPEELDSNLNVLAFLEELRRKGGVTMGLASSESDVNQASPKIGIVGASCDYVALDGRRIPAGAYDISVRMISMARAHRAAPLTGAMCLAAVCLTEGSLTEGLCSSLQGPDVRIGTPSGVLTVGAVLDLSVTPPGIAKTMVYSTARRLMDGWVNAG